MKVWEIWFASVGLSLDVYAAAICKGAVVGRVERRKLAQMCLIFGLWQTGALLLGNLFSLAPALAESTERLRAVWRMLTAFILVGIGGYMLCRGIRRQPVAERLEAWGDVKEMCLLSFATSADAFLTGIGFAFMESDILAEALAVGVTTVAAVAAGIYTGYLLGWEQKYKAYVLGGAIFIVMGAEVAVGSLL